jgi:hypothetical protein
MAERNDCAAWGSREITLATVICGLLPRTKNPPKVNSLKPAIFCDKQRFFDVGGGGVKSGLAFTTAS